jgi:hypothetical protein
VLGEEVDEHIATDPRSPLPVSHVPYNELPPPPQAVLSVPHLIDADSILSLVFI